jgi:hypothetical protein
MTLLSPSILGLPCWDSGSCSGTRTGMYHTGLNYVYSCLYNHHMAKKRTWTCTTLSSYVALSRFQGEYQFGKRDFKESCESMREDWICSILNQD